MNTKMVASVVCMSAILLAAAIPGRAVVISQMIGDDDGFNGTQGATSVPGQPYQVFLLPTLAPGTYVDEAGLDLETPESSLPYTFEFNFAVDLSGYNDLSSATLFIQSGSIKREWTRGFGHSEVFFNSTSLGEFYLADTYFFTEETVKGHSFDLTSYLTPGQANAFQVTLNGSSPIARGDVFALDFVRLTVDANVPDAGSSALLLGMAMTIFRAAQRRCLMAVG